jgi:hypothetical protein
MSNPKPNLLCCVPTRDGTLSQDVRVRLEEAREYAFQQGINSSFAMAACPYSVAVGRNKATAKFLQGPWSHLFFLDDDVLLQKDALTLLVQMDREIALGCYPSVKTPKYASALMYVPYLTVKGLGDQWAMGWFDGEREIAGGGTGCMLIRREVLSDLGFPWFRWPETYLEQEGLVKTGSDDMDFCERARERGWRIFAHGNVRCGHLKRVDVASFIRTEIEHPFPISWDGPKTLSEQGAWPAYGSHVPALCSVAARYNIRSVIEYGLGRYSTPTFLNKAWFPKLESLISVESDFQWLKEAEDRCGADARFTSMYCTLEGMPKLDLPPADLTFIDCDTTDKDHHDYASRGELLKRHAQDPGIIVIHDANLIQVAPYVEDAPFRYKAYYFPGVGKGPWTAVMSHTHDVTVLTDKWLQVPRPLPRTRELVYVDWEQPVGLPPIPAHLTGGREPSEQTLRKGA